MLVEEIVTRAKGVFLWVYLAVQSLLSGLRNADLLCDLQERLNQLPEGLENFFQKIYDSIDEVYKRRSNVTLDIVLQAERPLSVMAYWFLDEHDEDAEFAWNLGPHYLGDREVQLRLQIVQRRLVGRFKGLLETREHNTPPGMILTGGATGFKQAFYHFLCLE